MKAGDIVRFVRGEVDIGSQGNMYLREDCIGIIIKKVRHLPDTWMVYMPKMGGMDGYPGKWLELIDENTER